MKFPFKRNRPGTHCCATTLRFELLENRRVLATYAVTSLSDAIVDDPGDAPGTLRQAIFDANAHGGVDDIVFNLPQFSTISLSEGQLTVTESVNIKGPGAALLTIDASASDTTPNDNEGNGSRIFAFTGSEVEASVSGLWLTGGDEFSNGGAVWTDGRLTVSDCVLMDNAGDFGGAVFNDGGTLEIIDTWVDGNEAYSGGGGIGMWGPSTTSISGSKLRDNRANGDSGDEGGGAIYWQNLAPYVSVLTIDGSLIAGNRAPYGPGGGIAYLGNESGSALEIRDTRITENWASYEIAYDNAEPVILDGGGGVFAHSSGTVLISDSTIDNNTAFGAGGGLDLGGTISTIVNSTISGNKAMEGGGVWAAAAHISHSTITLNRAGIVPEIMDTEPFTTGGGGLHIGHYLGPGISNTVLEDTIVAGNFHQWDPGDDWLKTWDEDGLVAPDIGFFFIPEGPDSQIETVTLLASYSIIGTHLGPITVPQNYGQIVLSGTGNQQTDPLLGSLTDNGGFRLPDGTRIPTHLPGAPAIDDGNPSAAAGVGTVPQYDERGDLYTRVYNDRIDIGAVEAQPVSSHCDIYGDYNDNGVVDAADFVIWRKHFGSNFQLTNEDPNETPGLVTIEDYNVWRAHFGQSCNTAATGQSIHMLTISSDESDSDYDFMDVSLREAIELAADELNYPGLDIIVFAPWVNDIVLSDTLNITSDVSILGMGADQTQISGNGAVRPISVNAGVVVKFADLRQAA